MNNTATFQTQQAGVTRDNGFQLTNELRAAMVRALSLDSEQHRFVPFVFLDYGAGWNHAPNNTAWMAMAAIGPRFTYQVSRYASFRFTFGVPMERVGQTGQELRSQFSATATF